MPTRALSMPKIRELIRLKYQACLSYEQITGVLSISECVLAKYVGGIHRAGPEPKELLACRTLNCRRVPLRRRCPRSMAAGSALTLLTHTPISNLPSRR
jgi:hypothetical protein